MALCAREGLAETFVDHAVDTTALRATNPRAAFIQFSYCLVCHRYGAKSRVAPSRSLIGNGRASNSSSVRGVDALSLALTSCSS